MRLQRRPNTLAAILLEQDRGFYLKSELCRIKVLHSDRLHSDPSTNATAHALSISSAGKCPSSTTASSKNTAQSAPPPACSMSATWAKSPSPDPKPEIFSITSSHTRSQISQTEKPSTRRCATETAAPSTTSSFTKKTTTISSSSSTHRTPRKISTGSKKIPTAS